INNILMQTKKLSLIESITSTLIGFTVSLLVHDVKHIKTCNHIAYILTDIRYYFVHLFISN
ncbi:MAG TPA: hypothetical protein PLU45_03615, partial [Bacteroidales bacterium]|nr:hypothetical protein [Bacteroidales bacterium]